VRAKGYEPRFDIDYNERGVPGEKYAEAIREAIFRDRIEVKTDHLMATTGNVYVEFEQKSRAGAWIASGIAKCESELWMFASPSQQGALVIVTSTLKEVARSVWQKSSLRPATICKADPQRPDHHDRSVVGCCPYESSETRPTHGIKVPVKLLMDFAWTAPIAEVA